MVVSEAVMINAVPYKTITPNSIIVLLEVGHKLEFFFILYGEIYMRPESNSITYT